MRVPDAQRVAGSLLNKGILAGIPLGRYEPKLVDGLLVAVTEKRTKPELDAYVEAVAEEIG